MGNFFEIMKETTNGCDCALCGLRIEKGDCRRLVMPNYPKGKLIHTNFCMKEDMEAHWKVSKNSNKASRNCRQYKFHVIAPLNTAPYFLAYGFTYRKLNGTHARFTLDCKNNRTSGHIISTVLREGFKAFVDDTQVFDHEQFDKETKYIQLHDYTTELKR